MAYKITFLPLYADPVFSYEVSLEGKNFKLKFSVNTRQNLYHIDILSGADVMLVSGVALLPESPLCDKYDLTAYGLTGYFYLGRLNDKVLFEELDTDFLSSYFFLVYINKDTE